jgi:hypothetical protein
MILTNCDRSLLARKFLEQVEFGKKCSELSNLRNSIKNLAEKLLIRNLYSEDEVKYIENNSQFISSFDVTIDLVTLRISKNEISFPSPEFTGGKDPYLPYSDKRFSESIRVGIPKLERLEESIRKGNKSAFDFPMTREDKFIFREIQNLFIKFLNIAWEIRDIRSSYFQGWTGYQYNFSESFSYTEGSLYSDSFLKPNGVNTTDQLKNRFPELYVELIKSKSEEQELPNPGENKEKILNRLKKLTMFLDR